MSTAPTSAVRFGLLLLVVAVFALALACGVFWLLAVHPYLFGLGLSLGAVVGMFCMAVARRDDPDRSASSILGFFFCFAGFAISSYLAYGHYVGGSQ